MNANLSNPEPETVMDTSRMSEGQRAALELTEGAREEAAQSSFAGGIFLGRVDWKKLMPFPEQSLEDRDQGDTFLGKLEAFLMKEVNPDRIDEEGEIPQEVIDGLAKLGAFGIKIPVRYGGLGLSQANYCRAAMLLGSYCGNLTALLSAHQSIGVPQPLLQFGTEEQKQRYLPRVAAGQISAFALTEAGAGSDPATMRTTAEPTADGSAFLLNGEKIWCTNGTRAGILVVMAKTPPKDLGGRKKEQITAFIVETNWPGVEVVRRCRFMGLRSLYNAVIRFHDVRVPRENILFAEGKGLRVALTTLNTGRLTLPAACAGLAKRCLNISMRWAREREQWGQPIGRHAAIAAKLADMAADAFAMESMTFLTAVWRDRTKADLRLESAICKMWASEAAWRIVNDTMQVRGGRGYETAASLAARGEAPDPVERMLRDSRINTIFEGSSEIMRLFIAREALDPHLKAGAPVLDGRIPPAARARAAARAALHFGRWYPSMWLPRAAGCRASDPRIAREMRWIDRTTRRLARQLFQQMVRYGPALEKRQVLLSRFVEIGADLFAMIAVCARVRTLEPSCGRDQLLEVALHFCRTARLRIRERFCSIRKNADDSGYRLVRKMEEGIPAVLSEGIVRGV